MKHYAIQQSGRKPSMYFHTRGHRGEHVTEMVKQKAEDGTDIEVPVTKYVPNGPIGEWTADANKADRWDLADVAEAFRTSAVAPAFGPCTVEDVTHLIGAKHRKDKPAMKYDFGNVA